MKIKVKAKINQTNATILETFMLFPVYLEEKYTEPTVCWQDVEQIKW